VTSFLAQVRQHLPAAAALAYASGFLVTNVYLGSLGIVNVDILRSRYILTGILFMVFVSAIGALLGGAFRLLNQEHESTFQLIRKVLTYSFDRLAFIYFIGFTLTVLAQTAFNQPVGPPPFTSPQLRQDALSKTSLASIGKVSLIVASLPIGIVIVAGLVNGIRRRTLLDPVKKYGLRFVIILMLGYAGAAIAVATFTFTTFFLFSLLWNSIASLYTNMSEAPVSVGRSGLYGGFMFSVAVTLVYFLALVLLVRATVIKRARRSTAGDSEGVVEPFFDWVAGIAFGLLLLVPVYALAVYPSIPQHLGGGTPVPIRIELSQGSSDYALRGADVYLIDRTSDGALFLLVVKHDGKTKRVLEIPGSRVQVLEYRGTR
jgi:hypothetical protein